MRKGMCEKSLNEEWLLLKPLLPHSPIFMNPFPGAERSKRRNRETRPHWLPGNDGYHWRALLRFRERRNGSGSPGRKLVGGDVEPECSIARDVSHRGGIGGS